MIVKLIILAALFGSIAVASGLNVKSSAVTEEEMRPS
jgi:hypothetical protein